MTADSPSRPLSRRALLHGGAAAGLVLAGASRADAHNWKERVQVTAVMLGISNPPMRDPALLVAGSGDSASGQFASTIAPELGDALPAHAPLAITHTVGQDGVTGANQFDALTSPDGNTALVAPGSAWLAWLAGDPRVHFDAARWVPVLARTQPGVVILRGDVGDRLTDRTLRLAAAGPTGPQLPAWLGLSMLGARVVPVGGLVGTAEQRRALAEGHIDAAFLSGADATAPLDPGTRALFSLGVPHPGLDPLARDPALATVPSFAEIARSTGGGAPDATLFEAWRAAASAARLDGVLVLPGLAPAAVVAVWRRAARKIAGTPDAGSDGGPIPAPACLAPYSAALGSEAAIFALRRWLAETAGWRPG